MATNVAGITSTGLQKIVDMACSVARQPNGSLPAAGPNSFKDRLGTSITPSDAKGAKVEFRINPDGQTGTVKVYVESQKGVQMIEGTIDTALLTAALASFTA